MGRHSASCIAAQQGLPTAPTAAGAAKHVGRVGALALAMGVGAAVAGGAGLAYAEGSTCNGASGGAGSQSSPNPDAGEGGPAEASADGSSGAKTRKPGPLSMPKMLVGNRSALASHLPAQPNAGADPGSLPGVFSRIPYQVAAPEADGATGAGSPTRVRTTPIRTTLEGSDRPNGLTPTRPMTGRDDAVASFVRPKADDVAVALRGGGQPLGVVLSGTEDTTRQQRPTVSPAATMTPESAVGFAAPARAAQPGAAQTRAGLRLANPVATVVSGILSALGFSPSAGAGGLPVAPMQTVLGALQLISREIERIFVDQAASTASFTSAEAYANANPAIAPGLPGPGDEAPTAYGEVGKWMLQSNGQVSNWGGRPYHSKTLFESVNVIIVDPTSTGKAQATRKLNAVMFWAGFPAQPIHSTGFQGRIDTVVYGQQPTGLLSGFSDNIFVLPNNHGRIFGPDPVGSSMGYVWSGAFSTETLGLYNCLPTHTYVSSDMARTALAMRLILSGQATYVGMVPLDNAYNNGTTTTGDHDGYAVVLRLK